MPGIKVSEIVEAVSEEQLEQVRTLFREYQAELVPQYRAQSLESELAGLPGVYAPPKGKLLLATVAGQPVGCVGLRPFPQEGACEMKRLYVRPTFRGGKAGKLLVEQLVQQARALGYSRLRLGHPSANHAGGGHDVPQVRFPGRCAGACRASGGAPVHGTPFIANANVGAKTFGPAGGSPAVFVVTSNQ